VLATSFPLPEPGGVDLHVAGFGELDQRTAYALWRLRAEVFVLEQQCFYQDLDGRDLEPGTRHVWAAAGDGEPVGYLRVLDDGEHARIGRVLVGMPHRGRGLADRLMRTALELVGARTSVLDAQAHLAHWYTRYGYVRDGDDFVEDGIPHTPMRRVPAPPG
jgi:ElaA protein